MRRSKGHVLNCGIKTLAFTFNDLSVSLCGPLQSLDNLEPL